MLSVYPGTADPPTDLAPLTPSTGSSPAPTPARDGSNRTSAPAPAGSSRGGMSTAMIAGIAGGAGGLLLLTGEWWHAAQGCSRSRSVGCRLMPAAPRATLPHTLAPCPPSLPLPTAALLLWLKLRASPAVADAPEHQLPEKSGGGSASSKRSSRSAPSERERRGPSGLSVARSASGLSIDLEGARTPRYRQPITPRRPALKHSQSGGSGHAMATAAISLHASAGAGAHAVQPSPRLVPGVNLLPRVPGAGPGASTGVSHAVARTQAAVVDAQAARHQTYVAQQAARREAYLAQQAAEQAAMREYLRGKPQHVSCPGADRGWGRGGVTRAG